MRGHILDPSQRAAVLEWLGGLDLDERLAVLLAISFTFPILRSSKSWTKRIDACRAELAPSADLHVEIVIKAGRISARIKEVLSAVAETLH